MPSPTSPSSCARCRSPLVEIEISVDGSTVTMSSCSGCDLRTWRKDREVVALPDVLDDVGASRR
ncbi:MAG: hypothetical protein H0U26_00660 [Acidimicrobiia bacterium]|nr:hypothetical protein [Acidimicrobiia bacterium]